MRSRSWRSVSFAGLGAVISESECTRPITIRRIAPAMKKRRPRRSLGDCVLDAAEASGMGWLLMVPEGFSTRTPPAGRSNSRIQSKTALQRLLQRAFAERRGSFPLVEPNQGTAARAFQRTRNEVFGVCNGLRRDVSHKRLRGRGDRSLAGAVEGIREETAAGHRPASAGFTAGVSKAGDFRSPGRGKRCAAL